MAATAYTVEDVFTTLRTNKDRVVKADHRKINFSSPTASSSPDNYVSTSVCRRSTTSTPSQTHAVNGKSPASGQLSSRRRRDSRPSTEELLAAVSNPSDAMMVTSPQPRRSSVGSSSTTPPGSAKEEQGKSLIRPLVRKGSKSPYSSSPRQLRRKTLDHSDTSPSSGATTPSASSAIGSGRNSGKRSPKSRRRASKEMLLAAVPNPDLTANSIPAIHLSDHGQLGPDSHRSPRTGGRKKAPPAADGVIMEGQVVLESHRSPRTGGRKKAAPTDGASRSSLSATNRPDRPRRSRPRKHVSLPASSSPAANIAREELLSTRSTQTGSTENIQETPLSKPKRPSRARSIGNPTPGDPTRTNSITTGNTASIEEYFHCTTKVPSKASTGSSSNGSIKESCSRSKSPVRSNSYGNIHERSRTRSPKRSNSYGNIHERSHSRGPTRSSSKRNIHERPRSKSPTRSSSCGNIHERSRSKSPRRSNSNGNIHERSRSRSPTRSNSIAVGGGSGGGTLRRKEKKFSSTGNLQDHFREHSPAPPVTKRGKKKRHTSSTNSTVASGSVMDKSSVSPSSLSPKSVSRMVISPQQTQRKTNKIANTKKNTMSKRDWVSMDDMALLSASGRIGPCGGFQKPQQRASDGVDKKNLQWWNESTDENFSFPDFGGFDGADDSFLGLSSKKNRSGLFGGDDSFLGLSSQRNKGGSFGGDDSFLGLSSQKNKGGFDDSFLGLASRNRQRRVSHKKKDTFVVADDDGFLVAGKPVKGRDYPSVLW